MNDIVKPSLAEALEGIKQHHKDRKDQTIMMQRFHGPLQAQFTPKDLPGSLENEVHAYLVWLHDCFQLLLISKNKDHDRQFEGNMILVKIEDNPSIGDSIPSRMAKERIARWKEHRQEWVQQHFPVGSKPEMVQAFTIPSTDFTEDVTHTIYFALKRSLPGQEPPLYSVDLILWDGQDDTGALIFYDTVIMIPPFGSTGSRTDKEHFQLLKEAIPPI